ncbi:vacuolar membrane protein-domain-containing protein [Xylariales sp. PMI_506]|nr:vacuolar membrane protein-domain-containing protein [Xylariales sp. PMI_506]
MSPNPILDTPTTILLRDVSDLLATAIAKPHVGVDIPSPAADVMTSIMSTTTTALAVAATSLMSSPPSNAHDGGPADGPDGGSGECRLLGPFALIVQLALGGLALLSLVYKRWRERPQRPLKIWFFDASKQVFGSVLVHMANVFMSMLTSGRFSIKLDPTTIQAASRLMRRDDDAYTPNPCSFYLLNLAIDTTMGIPILIILLRITTGLVALTPLGKPAESIQSGHYGNPPNAWWWLKQSIIYFCGLFGMKICVLILFLALPWISRIGDWALKWTEGNERLQIVFSMMLFPLIMNAMQYYIIDGFIKKKESDHERLLSQDDDDDEEPYSNTLVGDDNELNLSDSGSDDLSRAKAYKGMVRKNSKKRNEEYNPEQDGHHVTLSSSSSSSERGKGTVLPKELVPAE